MHKSVDFDEFLFKYVGSGLVVGIIILLVVCSFVMAVYDFKRDEIEAKKNLYLVLEGKYTSEKEAEEAAIIIRSLVETDDTLVMLPSIENLYNIKVGRGSYLDILLKNKEEIIELSAGRQKNLSASITVPNDLIFLKKIFFPGWIFLSFCMTLKMTIECFRRRESLFSWPWQKPWVYFFILIMLPSLIPSMMVEAIGRKVFHHFEDKKEKHGGRYP